MELPIGLTIAGSDSSGGAGIQADLKVFSALGVYGMSVIASVTSQNTLGVHAVEDVSPDMVRGQLDSVLSDLGADVVKIGMLSNRVTIGVVSEGLRVLPHGPVVLDPLMVSKNGHRLLREDACSTLVRELFPLARLVTPNVPEAEILSGLSIRTQADMCLASERILALGAGAVLLKGGHSAGAADDLLNDGGVLTWFPGERIACANTHGTGCTLSSAISSYLAHGYGLADACSLGKAYVRRTMSAGLNLGKGCGPLHHFADWY